MAAGGGAQEQAKRAAAAARQLEKKAEHARRAAERWEKGAAGERKVATAIAPLAADGWLFLHDRVMPTGGNIDHVAIGPGGVVVIDAKAWSATVTIRDNHLLAGTYRQDKAIDGILAQAAAVQTAVGEATTVVPTIALTEQSSAPLERLTGVTIVGIDQVVDSLRQLPATENTVEVERLFRVLSEAFPPEGSAPAAAVGLVEVETIDELRNRFLKAHRWVYLRTWKKSGKHRIYASDDEGTDLGFKDMITGTVELTSDHPFAAAVLEAATPTGMQFNQAKLPKVPIDVKGGRLLGAIGGVYMSVFVGMRWEKGGKRRLYGTLADPKDGVHSLGWVDLDTGFVRPDSEGPVTQYRESAADYLGVLRDRLPR